MYKIPLSKGNNSSRAVSFGSSNQLLINIPFSGCNWKLSATLSTMITLCIGRPSFERS